ncbi:MAG: putative DNA binding domain-containing protein [Rhodospirillaceae bacterium]|nr:putative DNA binding domain-containing protein [Rhodospirillaceae bacterium]
MGINNPCALLDRLLQQPVENEWLEFKANNSNPTEIAEYISALANGAMLADRDRAFYVLGIEDGTKARVGTSVKLKQLMKGGENFENWLSHSIEPRLTMELVDFTCDGLDFGIICIEPSYDRPVRFGGVEFIRVGQNKRRLAEFPDRERALWLATGRRKFEHATALANQTAEDAFTLLDFDQYYELSGETRPGNNDEIIRRFIGLGFLADNMEGGFDITNLGAILFAKNIGKFPSIASKAIRIVRYTGNDKQKSDREQQGSRGYAVGFSGMVKYTMDHIGHEETYVSGVRKLTPQYPEIAIREILANALIHQDFTITGAAPTLEIYASRIEVTNPGSSLIDTDRLLDERRSRNEKLASSMRALGLCEERGGGLDKTMIEVEQRGLPAPEFISSENSMKVVLFGPRSFSAMTKQDKQRACFFHCVLKWMKRDFMTNASLRERFSLPPEEYQAVSGVISEAIKAGRIVSATESQGGRGAKYVPYWAAPKKTTQ